MKSKEQFHAFYVSKIANSNLFNVPLTLAQNEQCLSPATHISWVREIAMTSIYPKPYCSVSKAAQLTELQPIGNLLCLEMCIHCISVPCLLFRVLNSFTQHYYGHFGSGKAI